MDSFIFLAKLCPSLSIIWKLLSYYDWWGGLFGCCGDEWLRGAILQLQQLFCSRENQLTARFNQRNEKSTSNYTYVFV